MRTTNTYGKPRKLDYNWEIRLKHSKTVLWTINSYQLKLAYEIVVITVWVHYIQTRKELIRLSNSPMDSISNCRVLLMIFIVVHCVGGIRSVSFRGDVLTIGTSAGAILFYDVRAAKYMSSNRHPGEVIFRTNAGWVVRLTSYHFVPIWGRILSWT